MSELLPLIIIVATLIGVAVGRWPFVRMNRATIALVGGVGVVASGGIPLDDALRAIDLNTLALLLAMMILNANLRVAGVFDRFVDRFSRRAADAKGRGIGSPSGMLVVIVAVSGVASALLLNDTVVLVMTPLVIELCAVAKYRPVPYLVALGTAANVGSAATIIGNPQNMVIGTASQISFIDFTTRLAPVAAMGLIVIVLVIRWVYRRDFAVEAIGASHRRETDRPSRRHRRALRWKCGVAIVLMCGAMLAGVPVTLAALGAAAMLLLTRRVRPERVFREVDFSLLVFFAGLFVLIEAFGRTDLATTLFEAVRPWVAESVGGIVGVGAILSNLVSNVPAVLLLSPVIAPLPNPHDAWLTLALATTFAGNLTLLGSVANLIVAESARRHGVELSFGEYLKGGVPITLITLTLALGAL